MNDRIGGLSSVGQIVDVHVGAVAGNHVGRSRQSSTNGDGCAVQPRAVKTIRAPGLLRIGDNGSAGDVESYEIALKLRFKRGREKENAAIVVAGKNVSRLRSCAADDVAASGRAEPRAVVGEDAYAVGIRCLSGGIGAEEVAFDLVLYAVGFHSLGA